jgi:hypothetical protein
MDLFVVDRRVVSVAEQERIDSDMRYVMTGRRDDTSTKKRHAVFKLHWKRKVKAMKHINKK